MRTGWEIVIAGRNFNPTEFFRASKIQPTQIWEREIQEGGEQYIQQGIAFSDWHEGPYPLDMVAEALDYLKAHQDELQRLSSLSGIEERCLNFVDCCNAEGHGGSFDLAQPWISMLASLGFSVSICVLPQDFDSNVNQS